METILTGESQPTQELDRILSERLAAGDLDLPVLPQVASQVLQMTGDSNADTSKLAALVQRDPVLAGHVLRIANSPAYLPRTPIVSLQQAVTRLGLQVITEIAVAASLQSGVFRAPSYESTLSFVWRHSIASGAVAKEIARLRRTNVESAYLCGLLHEIGKPLVLQQLAQVTPSRCPRPDDHALEALLNQHHSTAGHRLAEKWRLPLQVEAAITHFADYENAASGKEESMVTCLADRLATYFLCPEIFDDETLRAHPVIEHLNLYPEDLDSLLEKGEAILRIADSMKL